MIGEWYMLVFFQLLFLFIFEFIRLVYEKIIQIARDL